MHEEAFHQEVPFARGLFPAVLDGAEAKSIALTEMSPGGDLHQAFTKRAAVDKGQLVFHGVSLVAAMPRYDEKDKSRRQSRLSGLVAST